MISQTQLPTEPEKCQWQKYIFDRKDLLSDRQNLISSDHHNWRIGKKIFATLI